MFPEAIDKLEAAIGYTFKNKKILIEALTHSSYANELKASKKVTVPCNERLEFLGDSVLSIIVSEYLYSSYSDFPEGELTKIRAAIVQSSALAGYAADIGLGNYLYLGRGEEKTRIPFLACSASHPQALDRALWGVVLWCQTW